MGSSILPPVTDLPGHQPPAPSIVPPLENGDRLTRAEFERRYEAMPSLKKAELIDGEVHMPSPVRTDHHAEPHLDLAALLGSYRHFTPGIRGGDNATVRLSIDDEPQPDGVLFIDPRLGGNATVDSDGYLRGAPEFVAEVAASSASIDLGKKLQAYYRNGVQEYLVWRVLDKEFDWFERGGDGHLRLPPRSEQVYASRVLPGLWLDTAAIVRGDFVHAQAVLRQGLDSPEHAAFVAELQKRQAHEPK